MSSKNDNNLILSKESFLKDVNFKIDNDSMKLNYFNNNNNNAVFDEFIPGNLLDEIKKMRIKLEELRNKQKILQNENENLDLKINDLESIIKRIGNEEI